MIRINQLKLQIPHTEEALEKKIQKTLHLKKGDSFTYRIHRQSLDARRKPELFYVYTVDVTVSNENAVLKHCKGNIQKVEEKHYQIPSHGTEIECPSGCHRQRSCRTILRLSARTGRIPSFGS